MNWMLSRKASPRFRIFSIVTLSDANSSIKLAVMDPVAGKYEPGQLAHWANDVRGSMLRVRFSANISVSYCQMDSELTPCICS